MRALVPRVHAVGRNVAITVDGGCVGQRYEARRGAGGIDEGIEVTHLTSDEEEGAEQAAAVGGGPHRRPSDNFARIIDPGRARVRRARGTQAPDVGHGTRVPKYRVRVVALGDPDNVSIVGNVLRGGDPIAWQRSEIGGHATLPRGRVLRAIVRVDANLGGIANDQTLIAHSDGAANKSGQIRFDSIGIPCGRRSIRMRERTTSCDDALLIDSLRLRAGRVRRGEERVATASLPNHRVLSRPTADFSGVVDAVRHHGIDTGRHRRQLHDGTTGVLVIERTVPVYLSHNNVVVIVDCRRTGRRKGTDVGERVDRRWIAGRIGSWCR